MKKLIAAVVLMFLLLIWLAVSASARSIEKLNHGQGDRINQVSRYNVVGPFEWVGKEGPRSKSSVPRTGGSIRRSIGSALSPDVGIGEGESIALTFNDSQYGFPVGRYVSHYWNGEFGVGAEAGVHFAYELCTDSTGGYASAVTQSGYNLYEATGGGDWPRGQDDGCALEENSPGGTGMWVNLDVMNNGTAILASTSRFFTPVHAERGYVPDNRIYYQEGWANCTYNDTYGTSYIDSTQYRLHWNQNIVDNYSIQAEVQAQFDGANTVVHVLLGEENSLTPPANDDYVNNELHRVFVYFRKVGEAASSSTWSPGTIIDTILEIKYTEDPFGSNGVTLFPSPNSGRVCISYSNPTVAARRLDGANARYDIDVYYRESLDYGVTWGDKVNVTNFDNATEGSPNHFKAWVESPCFYDSNDDLHIIWTGTPTSANPYYDGFNWNDFDTDIYHWARSTDEIVQVANGSYLNDDWLTGSMNGSVCGFAGQRTGYIYFIWLSECDGKLYCIWNQIHERANYMDWRSALVQPAAGILDDCGYDVGDRYGTANSEIMMSVAYIETSSLWDVARNISNTYTPNCGLPGDPLATGGPCGNEWKVAVEKYAMDETGLDLTWPGATVVDASPEGTSYSGSSYINLEYLDDQYPGGFIPNTRDHNNYGSLNSEKWVRLACVDPVPASEISAAPRNVLWPRWVRNNETATIPVVVKNSGNVVLNVSSIGFSDGGGGWLGVSETELTVPAGVLNTDTFNIQIAGGSSTAWLNGYVWLKSDAVNTDSLVIPINVLAADTVEPVIWDTVMTHPDMFDPYLPPGGTCIALAVGNMGELGWGAGSVGRVNLDYVEASGSSTMPADRRDCDTSSASNSFLYLVSSSPFVILANNSSGDGAVMSQSFNDANQADATGFDPVSTKGTITGGVSSGGAYDSVYTGKFVNRDTTVAMERIVYGPRSTTPATDTINFVVVYTKVYSTGLLPINHVTIGNASDWDVPADSYNHNDGGVSGGFVYVKGTDTTGHDACGSNEGRYATEAFGGGYTYSELSSDPCVNNTTYQGSNGVFQTIMVDTSFYLDGTPLNPAQPNPLRWWQTAAVAGENIDPVPDTGMDLCVFLTYKYDYTMIPADTLYYWTVMTTTPRNGTLAELSAQVSHAKKWYTVTVRGCTPGCCEGRVGNVNNSGEPLGEEITLGDIMLMVDVLFISNDCTKLACIEEADVNQSGGPEPVCPDDLTLGDIMILVDHLFIGQNPVNDCL